MNGQLNIWKTVIVVLVYVAACMAILVFSEPDYAASATPLASLVQPTHVS